MSTAAVGSATASTGKNDPSCTVARLLDRTGWDRRLQRDATARDIMRRSHQRLDRLATERPVYGVTRGFGPLVDYAADTDAGSQGSGLIHHLTVGQGAALPPAVTRTMVWLRLHGMLGGYSAVDPATWALLAEQWNQGFTPVVPQDGSLSASGDLVPLAHAAQAAAGSGKVWRPTGGDWQQEDAAEQLRRLGLPVVSWDARSALAFVNGTSAALARTLHNHIRLAAAAGAAAAATGRLAALLGCNPEAYAEALSAVRGHPGQLRAAALIRSELDTRLPVSADRPLQEPYSLRCAPQVVGAVVDQLRLQSEILVTEAAGCTDNPVLVGDQVLHGGNFHAAPVALACEQHASCVHQIAWLAERQLALVLDPHRNGGRPPLLTPTPGRQSGLAGLQIAASSHLSAIRQRGYPASFTAVPSNLGNQDHVPMALNGANTVAEMLDRAWLVLASLFIAINQLHHLEHLEHLEDLDHRERPQVNSPCWATLAEQVPMVEADRPLADEIRAVAQFLEDHFGSV